MCIQLGIWLATNNEKSCRFIINETQNQFDNVPELIKTLFAFRQPKDQTFFLKPFHPSIMHLCFRPSVHVFFSHLLIYHFLFLRVFIQVSTCISISLQRQNFDKTMLLGGTSWGPRGGQAGCPNRRLPRGFHFWVYQQCSVGWEGSVGFQRDPYRSSGLLRDPLGSVGMCRAWFYLYHGWAFWRFFNGWTSLFSLVARQLQQITTRHDRSQRIRTDLDGSWQIVTNSDASRRVLTGPNTYYNEPWWIPIDVDAIDDRIKMKKTMLYLQKHPAWSLSWGSSMLYKFPTRSTSRTILPKYYIGSQHMQTNITRNLLWGVRFGTATPHAPMLPLRMFCWGLLGYSGNGPFWATLGPLLGPEWPRA